MLQHLGSQDRIEREISKRKLHCVADDVRHRTVKLPGPIESDVGFNTRPEDRFVWSPATAGVEQSTTRIHARIFDSSLQILVSNMPRMQPRLLKSCAESVEHDRRLLHHPRPAGDPLSSAVRSSSALLQGNPAVTSLQTARPPGVCPSPRKSPVQLSGPRGDAPPHSSARPHSPLVTVHARTCASVRPTIGASAPS